MTAARSHLVLVCTGCIDIRVTMYICYATVSKRRDSSKCILRQFNIKDRHLTSPILAYPQTGVFTLDNADQRFNHTVQIRQSHRRVLRIKLYHNLARPVVSPYDLEQSFCTGILTRSRNDILSISFILIAVNRAYLSISLL